MIPVVVGGVCVGDTTGTAIDDGCYVKSYPAPHDDSHTKLMVRVASPEIPGVFQPTFHYDCCHNQVRAVLGRVIGVVPKPSKPGIARLREAAKWVAERIPFCPEQDIHAMPLRYSGAKRQRYMDAVDQFLRYGVQKFDAYCTMFVKGDRFCGEEKVDPDPRAIQFRGSKYCVALAQFLQPMEHFIYTLDCFSAGVPASRNVAKGLNSVDRAELLVDKMSHFRNPRVVSLDASRFDKHVALELLSIEHMIYTLVNPHWFFKLLLRMQLVSVVRAKHGFKYVVRGRRMSGDMNTALGNCLLMLVMLVAFMWSLSIEKWDCFDDGDDCLLIVEEEDLLSVLTAVQPHFLEYGMEMKVERVASSVHEVIFCKSSVVEVTEARFKFVRDYRAVISKSLSGIRHWQDPNYRIKVLRAIGLCELVLNLGVPVLQSFACAILRNVGRPLDLHLASDGLRARAQRELKALGVDAASVSPRLITEEARSSFAVAFDCPIDEQLYYERFFNTWTFDCRNQFYHGCEWDVVRWLPLHSTVEVNPLWQNAKTEAENAEEPTCQVGSCC